mgnify:FL=1
MWRKVSLYVLIPAGASARARIADPRHCARRLHVQGRVEAPCARQARVRGERPLASGAPGLRVPGACDTLMAGSSTNTACAALQNIKAKVCMRWSRLTQRFPWGQQSLFFNPLVNHPSPEM